MLVRVQGRPARASCRDVCLLQAHTAIGDRFRIIPKQICHPGAVVARSPWPAAKIGWFHDSPSTWWDFPDLGFSLALCPYPLNVRVAALTAGRVPFPNAELIISHNLGVRRCMAPYATLSRMAPPPPPPPKEALEAGPDSECEQHTDVSCAAVQLYAAARPPSFSELGSYIPARSRMAPLPPPPKEGRGAGPDSERDQRTAVICTGAQLYTAVAMQQA